MTEFVERPASFMLQADGTCVLWQLFDVQQTCCWPLITSDAEPYSALTSYIVTASVQEKTGRQTIMATHCQGPPNLGTKLCGKELGTELQPGFWCAVCKIVDYCQDCMNAGRMRISCKDDSHQLHMYKKPEERQAWKILCLRPALHRLELARLFFGRANGASGRQKNTLMALSEFVLQHYSEVDRAAARQLTARLNDEVKQKQNEAGAEEIMNIKGKDNRQKRKKSMRTLNLNLAWEEVEAAREVLVNENESAAQDLGMHIAQMFSGDSDDSADEDVDMD